MFNRWFFLNLFNLIDRYMFITKYHFHIPNIKIVFNDLEAKLTSLFDYLFEVSNDETVSIMKAFLTILRPICHHFVS